MPDSRLLDRLTPVAGPSHATEQADIDTLAEQLCGESWQGTVHAAGLVRHRAKVGGVNRYFYRLQLPDCHHMSYVAIKEDMSVGPSTELLEATVRYPVANRRTSIPAAGVQTVPPLSCRVFLRTPVGRGTFAFGSVVSTDWRAALFTSPSCRDQPRGNASRLVRPRGAAAGAWRVPVEGPRSAMSVDCGSARAHS